MPIGRFKCSACGAQKDAGFRNISATIISCICGGVANKIGVLEEVEDGRWRDVEGNPVGILATENPLIGSMLGMQKPSKKSFIGKIRALIRL